LASSLNSPAWPNGTLHGTGCNRFRNRRDYLAFCNRAPYKILGNHLSFPFSIYALWSRPSCSPSLLGSHRGIGAARCCQLRRPLVSGHRYLSAELRAEFAKPLSITSHEFLLCFNRLRSLKCS
jgi:hypothetical protein